MVFKGKIVKTDDDYAFVLVDEFEKVSDRVQNKPLWKTENKIGAKDGEDVKVESSTWSMFIGKLPDVVEVLD